MSPKIVRRGYDPGDIKAFTGESLDRLFTAHDDIKFLVDRGYKLSNATDFVGNHFQLSARQRIALKRAISPTENCNKRISKMLPLEKAKEGLLHIDGFNLIISLEVALSKSPLILGDDGVIRDLAGLRGTYKPIDKTDISLSLIGKSIKELRIPHVKFFLDEPVSNSGILRGKILSFEPEWGIKTEVELVPNPDAILSQMHRVVSSDSIILDHCKSWFNLPRYIIESHIKDAWILAFL